MISFICENANVEALENAVKKALIYCVAEAVSPLFGDYDRTGLDYSACKTEQDKRIVFAKDFLGDINIEPIEGGIVLNDELDVEGTCNDAPFDLKKLIMDVKGEFPDLHVSGEGEIDYHNSMCEYEIFEVDGIVHVLYDGFEDGESEDYDFSNDDSMIENTHFTSKLPKMIIDEGIVIDKLLDYKKQKENSISFDKNMEFSIVIASQFLLVYAPVNEDSLSEIQKIGFPLNPNAKGVLFVYMADGNYETSTDQLLAVCGVLNGPDNEWACPNPALQNMMPTYYEICVAANLYLQDKGLYDEYLAMDEYTILKFKFVDDELITKKIVL